MTASAVSMRLRRRKRMSAGACSNGGGKPFSSGGWPATEFQIAPSSERKMTVQPSAKSSAADAVVVAGKVDAFVVVVVVVVVAGAAPRFARGARIRPNTLRLNWGLLRPRTGRRDCTSRADQRAGAADSFLCHF